MKALRLRRATVRHIAQYLAAFTAAVFTTAAFGADIHVPSGTTINGALTGLAAGDTILLESDVAMTAAVNIPAVNFAMKSTTPGTQRVITAGPAARMLALSTVADTTYTWEFNNITMSGARYVAASGGGGAISVSGGVNSTLKINGSSNIFSDNQARNGGAIFYNMVADLEFAGSVQFLDNQTNSTAGHGGAIYMNAGKITFGGATTFDQNKTNGNGGAVRTVGDMIFNGAALVTSNTVDGTATANGGALYSAGLGKSIAFNSGAILRGNETKLGRGGAIFSAGSVTIKGSGTISGNRSGAEGGAIFFGPPTGSLTNPFVLTLNATTGDIVFDNNQQNTAATASRNAVYYTLLNANSMVFDFSADAGRTIAFNDPISGTNATATIDKVTLTKSGSGTLLFDRWHTDIAATTTINTGTMKLTNGTTYGLSSGTGIFTLASGAVLAGNGKIQAGAITISNNSTLEALDGGTLMLDTAGTRNIGAGLTLDGSGTINAGAPLNASAIRIGALNSTSAAALTLVDNLTLAGGVTLHYDATGGATSDLLVTNNVTFAGTGTFNFGTLETGTFMLLTWSGVGLSSTTGISISANNRAMTARNQAALTLNANSLQLTNKVVSLDLAWTGADGGAWKNSANAAGNWTDGAPSNAENFFRNGDSITFDGNAPATTRSISVDDAVTASQMRVTGAADFTFTGTGGIKTDSTSVIAGSAIATGTTGKLIKTGAGTLAFANTGTNTFSGGIDIGGGVVAFNNTAQLGDGGNGITFSNTGTLRATVTGLTLSNTLRVANNVAAALDVQTGSLTFTGALQLAPAATSGTFAKTGAGDLRLTSNNAAYAGAFLISNGRLTLAAASQLGGAITIGGGGKLAGSGIAGAGATGGITALSGAIIEIGDTAIAGAQNITLNNLTATGGLTLKFDLFDDTDGAYKLSDRVISTGLLNITGSNTIDISVFKTGTFNLGNITAFAPASTGVTINGETSNGGRQTAYLDTALAPGSLLLIAGADMSRIMTWTGGESALWNSSGTNWTDFAAATPTTLFAGGDRVIFSGTADVPSRRTITVNSGVNVSDMRVEGSADYTFDGAGGVSASKTYIIQNSGSSKVDDAQGKLVKTGAGTLTFANTAPNNFAGGIDISGGVIAFSNGAQLGTAGATSDSGINFLDTGTLRPTAGGATLASKISIVATKTAVIDIGANTFTWSSTFGAASSGTLAKTGAGLLLFAADNSSNTATAVAINSGTALLATGARLGSPVTVDTGAIFGGAGSTTGLGGVTALAGSTIQIGVLGDGTETFTAAKLNLAGGSMLTGAGTLASAAQLGSAAGDLVTATIAAGKQITISAALTGPATLVKTGAGTLVYSGTGAFGIATTRIDQGVVMIRNITGTNAGALSHTFNFNGGWLDLSETTYDPAGNNANTWTNLHFTGSLGGVIGSNDKIVLGAGATAYGIGSASDTVKQGVFVVVNAGAGGAGGAGGVATMTGSNNYVGYTMLQSGMLQISANNQLGLESANREIVFTGGTLAITANNFSTTRELQMRQDGGIVIDGPNTAAWNGNSTGAGVLTKSGVGTLILTGNSTRTGATIVAGGTLQGNSASLKGSIANNAALVFNQLSTGTYAGVISGSGSFEKTGAGILNLLGNSTYSGATVIREGMLVAGAANVLSANSDYAVRPGGELAIGLGQTIKTLANDGALSIAASVNSAKGIINTAPTLTVSGAASGTGTLLVRFIESNTTTIGDFDATLVSIQGADTTNYAIAYANRAVNGVYDWSVEHQNNAYVLNSFGLSPEVPAATAIPSVALLMGQAGLDSVTQRLGELRYDTKHLNALWARGIYNEDNLKGRLYDGAHVQTNGVQVGADHLFKNLGGKGSNNSLSLGVFADDFWASSRPVPASKVEATQRALGIYGTYVTGGWHIDALMRFDKNEYDVSAPDDRFSIDGKGTVASLEAGYRFEKHGLGRIEPMAQVVYQKYSFTDNQDRFHRPYTFDDVESLQARIGIGWSAVIKYDTRSAVIPWLRLTGGSEFKGDQKLTIQRVPFENDLSGSLVTFEGGLTIQLADRAAFYASALYRNGKAYDSKAASLGVRFMW